MTEPTYFTELLNLAVRLRVRTNKAKGSYPHGLWQIYKDIVRHHQISPACIRFNRFMVDPMALEYWFKSNQVLLEDRANIIRLTGRKPRLPRKAKAKSPQPAPVMLKKSPNALTKSEKTAFFKSREWLQLRYRVLAKYGRRCMCCGAKAGNGIYMHVDHIKPMHAFPELGLDFDNLQVLCCDCNYGKGAFSMEDFRPKTT